MDLPPATERTGSEWILPYTSDRRTGTLWEGCCKASLIDSEAYVLTCMFYFELNALRAGMVEHAGECKWSSYGANATGRPDRLLSLHPLYPALGPPAANRQFAYRELFRNHLDEAKLHETRDALDHELVLGRFCFKYKIEAMTHRQTRPAACGRRGPRLAD